MEKRCPTCGLTKPESEFGKNKRTSDGLACYCKPCTSEKNRAQYVVNQERRKVEAREYRHANIETVRERDRERWQRRKGAQSEFKKADRARIREVYRAWYAANPGYTAEWRRSNPGRIEYEKAWGEANRELRTQQAAARRENNPIPFLRAKHAYRARKRNAPHVPYSDESLIAKLEYWAARCWICTSPLSAGFHWDHVKPLNKGGADMLANLRPACGPCNQGKQDRWPYTPSRLSA